MAPLGLLLLTQISPAPWSAPYAPAVGVASVGAVAADAKHEGVMLEVARGAYRAYRATVSEAKGSTCHFSPTCSVYGMSAIERFGVAWGLVLFAGRLMKNHADFSGYYRRERLELADPLEENALWLTVPEAFRWEVALASSWRSARSP